MRRRTFTRRGAVIVVAALALVAVSATLVVSTSSSPSALSIWAQKYERPDARRLHEDLQRVLVLRAPVKLSTITSACLAGQRDVESAQSHPNAPEKDISATYAAVLSGQAALYASCLFSLRHHSSVGLRQMGQSLTGIYQMQTALRELGRRSAVRLIS